MKILVTGSSGFLGQRVISILSKRGNHVVCLDSVSSHKEEHNFILCDLTRKEKLSTLLKNKFFDSVIHLAGIRGDYNSMLKVNVEGSTNLIEALNIKPGSIILASSCAVYGVPEASNGCIHESDAVTPITDYGKTMLKKEQLTKMLCSQREIAFASARIFNLFGADQAPSMMTSAVARKLVKISLGKLHPPLHTGPLHTLRDLIDVDDVAEAMVLMATKKATGYFNLGTGIPKSGTEIVRTFQSILKMQIPVEINSEFNPMVQAIYADVSKVRSELNWAPAVSFQTTIQSIVDYWLKKESI